MRGAFLVAAGLLLAPLPALSQGLSDQSDRGSSSSRGDLEELLRSIGDETSGSGGGGPRRGAGFLLRSGDATVAVRCDARESMRSCVEATTTLLERARSTLPPGSGGTTGGTTSPTPPR